MPQEPVAVAELFDSHAASYRRSVDRAVGFSGLDLAFFTAAKAYQLRKIGRSLPVALADATVLDVGCGAGGLDSLLIPHARRVVGVDVSRLMVDEASSANPKAQYLTYDGERLPFDDRSFDLTFAACVVHHVAPAQWADFQAEMLRVTSPGGAAVIIEHNPWNPLTRHSVAGCEFDADAVLTTPGRLVRNFRRFGARQVKRRYMLFSPLKGRRVQVIERAVLGWVPLGAQYAVEAWRGAA
jgi:SAM-dependent methyltransferase